MKTAGTDITTENNLEKKCSLPKYMKKEIIMKKEKKKIEENEQDKQIECIDTENDIHCISKGEKQKKELSTEKKERDDENSMTVEEGTINKSNNNNYKREHDSSSLKTNIKSKLSDCDDNDINTNKSTDISLKSESEIDDLHPEKKYEKKSETENDLLKLCSKRKHILYSLDTDKVMEANNTLVMQSTGASSNSSCADCSNENKKRNIDFIKAEDASKKMLEKEQTDNAVLCQKFIDGYEGEGTIEEKKALSKLELMELVNAVNKNMSCNNLEYINNVWSVEKKRKKEEKKKEIKRKKEEKKQKKKLSKKLFFENCNENCDSSSNCSGNNMSASSYFNKEKKNVMEKRKRGKMITGDKVIQYIKRKKQNCSFHYQPSMLYSISLLKNHECQRIRLPYYCIKILQGHKDEVWHASISASGKYIASSSKDKTIILWGGSSPFSKLREWFGHVDGVSNICWSHNSKYLISGSNDSNIILWSPKSNKKKLILSMHSAPITSICWSKDDSMIISSGYDKKVFCTKLREDLKYYDVLYAWSFNTRIQNAVVTNDDKYLVVVASDKNVRILDFRLKTELYTLPEFDSITSICASSLYNHILVNVGDQKPTIKLWDVKYRYIIQTYRGHKQGRFIVHSTFGGKNENYVISGSEDSLIYIWHKTKGYLLDIINGHASTVNIAIWPISYSKFPYMVSASDDHTLMIWSVHPKIDKKKEIERKEREKKKKKEKKEKKEKDKKTEKYKALAEKKEIEKLFMHPFLRELRQLSLKKEEEH